MLLIVASILNFYSRDSLYERSCAGISLVITFARGLTGGTKLTVRAQKSEWKSNFESDSRSICTLASLDRSLTNSRYLYPRKSRRKWQKSLIINLFFSCKYNSVSRNFLSLIFFCGLNHTSFDRRDYFYFLSGSQMNIDDQW